MDGGDSHNQLPLKRLSSQPPNLGSMSIYHSIAYNQ